MTASQQVTVVEIKTLEDLDPVHSPNLHLTAPAAAAAQLSTALLPAVHGNTALLLGAGPCVGQPH